MTDQPPNYPPPPPEGYGYGQQQPGGYGYGQQQPPPGGGYGGGYPPQPGYGAYPPQQGGYGYQQQSTGTNGMAIASLACSIVGVCCGIGPILGLIFGFIALNQIKQTGQDGRGIALAGIIVGAIMTVFIVIFAILRFAVAANEVHHDQYGSQPAVVISQDWHEAALVLA